MTDHLKLWHSVAKTDPKHTKEVKFGRKFTNIDPMYQIMRTTETFGPVGIGWTYQAEHSVYQIDEELVLALCDVTIQYYTKSDETDELVQGTYGPVRGCEQLFGLVGKNATKPTLDDDAPKKAMTDALTKALSHLGMNADVFLGLFDDNKYVARVREEFNAKDKQDELREQANKDIDWLAEVKDMLDECQSANELNTVKVMVKSSKAGISKGTVNQAVQLILDADKKYAES